MFFGRLRPSLGVDLGAGGVKLVELKREKQRPVLVTYGFTSTALPSSGWWRHFDVAQGATPTFRPRAQGRVGTAEGWRQLGNGGKLFKNTGSSDAAGEVLAKLAADNEVTEQTATLVREVCKQARVLSKTATVSLPVAAVFHAVVTVPRVPPKALAGVVKGEVEKLLPFPLAEALVDYQELGQGEPDKTVHVLVNAVPRALVAFYTNVFARAGLKLAALETEAAALARSLVGREEALITLVDCGAERTNFFIIRQGVPVTHQSIEVGGLKMNQVLQTALGVSAEEVEQIKYDVFRAITEGQSVTLPPRERWLEMLRGLLDPIVKEIEYGFDLYLRQSSQERPRPEKIILTGGGALVPYLPQYLSEKFNLKCYIGDPWGRVVYQDGLRQLLQENGPRMAVAIGLALRGMV